MNTVVALCAPEGVPGSVFTSRADPPSMPGARALGKPPGHPPVLLHIQGSRHERCAVLRAIDGPQQVVWDPNVIRQVLRRHYRV